MSAAIKRIAVDTPGSTEKAGDECCRGVILLPCNMFLKITWRSGTDTVTGSNKGIGFAIVRGLCKKFDGDVFLTARNEAAGQEAVKVLNSEGLHPKFHQLDITASDSVERLKSFLHDNYGGLDVLVNNAGIAYKMAATEPFSEQAEVTVATNFCATLSTCRSLFRLLRPDARVVNVSSMASNNAGRKCSPELKSQFAAAELSMTKVEKMMTDFVQAAKDNTFADKGWPQHAYGVSKVGVTLMTFMQQKDFSSDPREDIVVNACCPGHVATDMSRFTGKKTIDDGADTPLYLAMLPKNTPPYTGKLVSDRKASDWP